MAGSVMIIVNDYWKVIGTTELAASISYDDVGFCCFAVACLQVLGFLPNTFFYRKSRNQAMG